MSTSVDAEIRRHRSSEVTLKLRRADGSPLANETVTIEQRNHAFLFGGNGHGAIALANDELEDAARDRAQDLSAKMIDVFNYITLPFYWGRFEPTRGKPDTRRLLNAARWFVERGCKVKGHPLCWHTVCADWLLDLDDDQIIRAQLDRIRREVTDFAGVIDAWDVINEVVIMPTFDKYDNGVTRMCRKLGRIGMIRETFAAAREANPRATLLLNDFDMSPAYERLIEDVLEAGIRIDALGLQSHMHQGYWGVEKTLNVLERFSRYRLPIHFTETNIISGDLMPAEIVDLNDFKVEQWPSTSGGEARQAEEVILHYETLLAHPAVKAITWWDFIDGGWLKAPAGLVRADRSLKPAYTALRRLIKGEWWLPPTQIRTDVAGVTRFTGFHGDYRGQHADRAVEFAVSEASAAFDLTI